MGTRTITTDRAATSIMPTPIEFQGSKACAGCAVAQRVQG